AAARVVAGDQALVLQLLERGVDGAGAGPPDAAAARLDVLDHLVAVPGPLAEQQEQRRPDVAAPHPGRGVHAGGARRGEREVRGWRSGGDLRVRRPGPAMSIMHSFPPTIEMF